LFDVKSDPQSVELIGKVDQVGIVRAVAEYTGFEAGSDVHDKIISGYETLKAKRYDGTDVRRADFVRYAQ
jgi:hypothetical protein